MLPAIALRARLEAGLRFFLPAYLIADVQEQLKSADPVILLTNGFSDVEVRVTMHDRDFVVRTGKSVLLNPLRYGAATFLDYLRYRFSIFTREEARAIVAYLDYKRELDTRSPDSPTDRHGPCWLLARKGRKRPSRRKPETSPEREKRIYSSNKPSQEESVALTPASASSPRRFAMRQ